MNRAQRRAAGHGRPRTTLCDAYMIDTAPGTHTEQPTLLLLGIGDEHREPIAVVTLCGHSALALADELRAAAEACLAEERDRGCGHGFDVGHDL